MFKNFTGLQWKSFFRSSSLGKSLGIKIFMGFMAVYLAVSLIMSGIGAYFALEKIFPESGPFQIINRFLIYYFCLELFIRYFMQKLPVMDIKPFLILPIKKSSITHYILGRSAVSFYNFLSLFFFLPFCVVLLYKGFPVLNVLGWLMGIIALVLTINYINFLVNKSDRILIAVATIIGAFYALEYFDIVSITEYFGALFYRLYEQPYLVIIPIGLVVLVYWLNYKFLRTKLFLDATLENKTKEAQTSDMAWTRRFGKIAPFLQLDLKLIWRNKRTKTQVFISLAMILYGLIFYTMKDFGPTSPMLVFVGIFMTGIFLMNFGQFIPAWDSEYYSMMMSQNIPLRDYLESKAGLIYVSVVVMFLLSIPYVYFGWEALAINFACALYNLGVNVPVILFFGSMNKKRIDLAKSAMGNMQGASAAQFLVGIPLFGLPMILFVVLSWVGSFQMAISVMALLGILGFALRKPILDNITKIYAKKKYGMIAGFKEKNS
ncbi:DUF5687 family protein [Cytophaga sp. FL35]|uniref:DUF5687 family protein n=1 Tax=Cytophaga sp. FL35 TaxID=1904456 RepID=UPI001653BC7C|nr:DUF5687 family protein [Cytophaga sp. FL35]MBC6997523.1 hypothetical protein [Cytophaga sp. FL35]